MRTFRIEREVDHHDGVLLDDADQQNHPDQGDDAEFGVEHEQSQHRANSRRGQGGQNGDRVNVAFVQNAQHDIHGDQGGGDQQRLAVQRLLESLCRALEAAVDARRHPDLPDSLRHRRSGIAERFSGREVERNRGGDKQPLMVHRQRRVARAEFGEGGQWHHRFLAGADGGARGSTALAGVGERIGCRIARRTAGDAGRIGRTAGGAAGGGDRADHRVAGLRAAGRPAGSADKNVFQRLRRLPVARLPPP